MSYAKKRPLGRFSITRKLLQENWRIAKDVMSRVVVVKCESDFVSDSLIYTAFSDEFEESEEAFEPPTYYIEMYQNEDKSIHMTRFTKA